jgi:hypothetical protein
MIQAPYLGVIEGFFGKSWEWCERADYASFLRTSGYSFYIYAPKDDPFLRKRWREPCPEEQLQHLESLAQIFRAQQVHFGVGLSPFEAYRDYSRDTKKILQDKVRSLNPFSSDVLAVLFDDMRGDLPDLARNQIEMLTDIREVSSAKRIVFCPTYYSYDPILERVFGAMPERYLEDLGAGLDPTIDIFWTGPRVCSTEYPRQHLEEVASRLQRKPFLWDNYPVNDSKKMSPFLHLRPFENRGSELADLLSGHAVNPMKQPYLSYLPLATLPHSYARGGVYDPFQELKASVGTYCGEEVGAFIVEDLPLFQDVGLAALSAEQRQHLTARYSRFVQNPFCAEIVRWLEGKYEFDPACLTD